MAGATDWPGLDRWGKTDDDALEKLSSYLPRYAGVAERAGMAKAFARQRTIEVAERYTGSSSTDFWGIAHVPSETEREVLSEKDLERRLGLLQACWAYFDDVAARVSEELRPHANVRDSSGMEQHPRLVSVNARFAVEELGLDVDIRLRGNDNPIWPHRDHHKWPHPMVMISASGRLPSWCG